MSEPDTNDLIGTPFKYGGRGPSCYDCYGLLVHLYKIYNGKNLPDYGSPDDMRDVSKVITYNLKNDWVKTEYKPHVAVVYRMPEGKWHVGFTLSQYEFIHIWEKSNGIIIERLSDWEKRQIGFYDYKNNRESDQ